MNNNIQCSIESSTTKIELNSAVDGVFLVPELEGLVGLPEIRTTSGVNAGYDGGWTSAQNYDARLISIRGVIANPDISKVEDKRRAIASLLGQGRKEQLTLRFTTEAGNAYAISVRTISCEMALQRVLTTQEFLIQLRADDPLIYDDGTTGGIAAILQPQRALGGFEINFGLPLAIGGGAEDTVVDNGNETVYPVIKLYGALHSPTVVNRTTNQQMQILADLQYSIDWHTYRSATGDYILVSDGLNGAPMTLSQLTGNAEQTTYSGKNLLYATELPKTQSNVTATYQDGIFGLSGTSAAAANLYVLPHTQSIVHLEAGESITMYIERVSGTSKVYFTGYFEPDDASAIEYDWGLVLESGASTVKRVRTASKAGNLTHVQMFINANTTYNSTVKILVQKGNIADPTWEQYVGGTPAPNPSYPQPISTVTGAQNVKVTGKNLLGLQDDTLTSNGVDFAINNGTITASGTTTAASNAENDNIIGDLSRNGNYPLYATITEANSIELRAGTYTVSAEITKTGETSAGIAFGTGATMGARITGLTKLEVRINDVTGTYTKTATFTIAEGERLYVSTYYEGNATKKNVGFTISNIQLEEGSTATAYEPYQGQSYEVNLGKNLLDNKATTRTYLGVTLTKNNDGSITLNGTSTGNAQFYLDVNGVGYQGRNSHLDAGTYTINGRDSDGVKLEINHMTTNGNSKYSYGTFTEVEPFDYGIYVTVTNGTTVNNLRIYPQLERGSRATTYAPYFTPIELAKIGNYQDRIYKNEGKWYIEKQIEKATFDGSSDESWVLGTTGSLRYPFGIDIVRKGWASSTIDGVMCDTFTLSVSSELGTAEQYQFTFRGTSYNNRLWFFCPKSAITGSTSAEILASYKTFLSTHPTTVYYALATPTTTEVTDETLRAQLNFLASLYEGENNISLVGTGAQGEMAISYATDYTVNQDVITIDSQARTITLNGQDVYHLKTSESEFLVLAPGENKLYLTSEVSDDSGYAEVKFKQGYLSI